MEEETYELMEVRNVPILRPNSQMSCKRELSVPILYMHGRYGRADLKNHRSNQRHLLGYADD
jgi:hypothetical protein